MKAKRWSVILIGAVIGLVIGYINWKYPGLGLENKSSQLTSMTCGFTIGLMLTTILTSPRQVEN